MRVIFFLSCFVSLCSAKQPLEIRFDSPPQSKPANSSNSGGFFNAADSYPSSPWEQDALPVGNGRIGAMIFGNPLEERIQFNDVSLWTGGANPSGGYSEKEFGSYQNFGDLFLRLESKDAADKTPFSSFSRSLDLTTGIHTTKWQQNGVSYQREVFASKPHEVIVIRITADKPGSISGAVLLKDAHPSQETTADGFLGALDNNLRYAARIKILADGGKVTPGKDSVSFSGNSATILLAAATDYALDPEKNFRSGIDPAEKISKQLATAAAVPFAELRANHLNDFSRIIDRVDLDVGAPPAGDIAARLAAYKKGDADPHLEALLFHYGRYLLASCSRGFLPANLQGLWNDKNKPAWFADYHTNINIQMNYWLAEPANLSDCAMPLFDWTDAMIPGSRAATAKAFGEQTPGWTMRTSANIYGGNGWAWNMPSSAWLALHYMEHYHFTGDKEFLAKRAWPVFHGVCQFWLSHLVEKDGKLLVPQGWSPEHGPREDGVAHDQQIIWDLFTNTLMAAEILGKKSDFTAQIEAAREKLLGPQIGSWGQLMEWTTERPQLEKSGHRHTSHLFAVFPGNQITLTGTPDLAKAAAISLEARGTSGDSRRSWTWPWRTALWARLGRADQAGKMIRGLLVHNTLPNLYTTHPPFQIDGNLGITAGVCETLLQSHAGEISLLPAVPPQWPSGSFSGLKARGGFEISAVWKDGKPVAAKIKSLNGNALVLRIPGNPRELAISRGNQSRKLQPTQNGTFRLPTEKGSEYSLKL